MLPTFVLVGAMKAGTTSLASYLGSHPDVFVTTPKETDYLTQNLHLGLPWYEALFDGAGSARARGEASTSYSKVPDFPGVPERLTALVPDVQVIYLVRNPVQRIASHYVHRSSRLNAKKIERLPIEKAVRTRPEYLDWSRYALQLRAWLEHVDRSRILVLSSEGLKESQAATLATAFEFLGVDPTADLPPLDYELNSGHGKKRVSRPARVLRGALKKAGASQEVRLAALKLLQRQDIDATISPELEAWIWSELRDDLDDLRTIVGPDHDLWESHG